MALTKYVTICWCCGKAGQRRTCSSRPASTPPSIPGKCPSSPDGKHKPRWEEE